MPIIINQKIKQGHTTFIEYSNVLNLVEPSVLYSPIPFTVFKRGQSLHILMGQQATFIKL